MVDVVQSISHGDQDAAKHPYNSLQVTETTIECNLVQRQRSSQQILDLADFLSYHSSKNMNNYLPRKYYPNCRSFSSEVPIWIELAVPSSFFPYFEKKFTDFRSNVMLIWNIDNKPTNLEDIEEFCGRKQWRCTYGDNVRGSESSVTILYDHNDFHFEFFTRAKTQLVIVTLKGKKKYVLLTKRCSFFKVDFCLCFSELSDVLQNIEKGRHNDECCEECHEDYIANFGYELEECEFKGDLFKIQKLIKKIHVDANGTAKEIKQGNSSEYWMSSEMEELDIEKTSEALQLIRRGKDLLKESDSNVSRRDNTQMVLQNVVKPYEDILNKVTKRN